MKHLSQRRSIFSDTKCVEMLEEKTAQHGVLVSMLTPHGFDVQLIMSLGYAGTIYHSNLSALRDMGLARTPGQEVLK